MWRTAAQMVCYFRLLPPGGTALDASLLPQLELLLERIIVYFSRICSAKLTAVRSSIPPVVILQGPQFGRRPSNG